MLDPVGLERMVRQLLTEAINGDSYADIAARQGITSRYAKSIVGGYSCRRYARDLPRKYFGQWLPIEKIEATAPVTSRTFSHLQWEALVRDLLANGMSYSLAARTYGVSRAYARDVGIGKTLSDVLPNLPRRELTPPPRYTTPVSKLHPRGARSCRECVHWNGREPVHSSEREPVICCGLGFPESTGLSAARHCPAYLIESQGSEASAA